MERCRRTTNKQAHELDLAAALLLAMPTAAASLALLANNQCIHPEGALVLGALLPGCPLPVARRPAVVGLVVGAADGAAD